ncbi:flagellar basal-body MS-ring/collar protein FliF [Endozoicomonadaceae bacterium StTr2]
MSSSAVPAGEAPGKSGLGKPLSLLSKTREGLEKSSFGSFVAARNIPWSVVYTVLAGLVFTAVVVTWLWRDQGAWQALYGRQELYNTAAVIEVLEGNQIAYRIHPESGQVMVPSERLSAARMQLAVAGQVPEQPPGMDILETEGSFGRSQFVERARYLQGLEGELSRTIISLRPVRNARVHLAIPERTAFLRERQSPSASVYIDLYPGTRLDARQVRAIARLIAGSVPGLKEEDISVLDQSGNLLSSGLSDTMDMTQWQTTYVKQLETRYINNINSLLEAIVGSENLRVQVNVDVDFSVSESTAEGYNPGTTVIRSESVSSDSSSSEPAQGVPGVESNRRATASQGKGSEQNSSSTVRNYEVGRTVSRIQQRGPQIKQVSVAVVLNSLAATDPLQGWDENVRNEMSRLIGSAVGLKQDRGDQVNIGSLPFVVRQTADSAEETIADVVAAEVAPEGSLMAKVLALPAPYLAAAAGVPVLLLIAIIWMLSRRRKKRNMPDPVAIPGEDPFAKEDQLQEPNLTDRVLDDVRRLARENPDQVAHILQQWIEGDNR